MKSQTVFEFSVKSIDSADKKLDLEPGLSKSSLQCLLNSCINVGYYVCVYPFRINDDGTIVKTRWRLILCLLIYFLAFHRYIIEVLEFPFERLSTGPVDYFLLFQKISTGVSFLIFSYMLWFTADKKLVKISNFIQTSYHLRTAETWLSSHSTIRIMTAGYLLIGLANFLLGVRIVHELSYMDFSSFYRRYVAEGRFVFSLSREANKLRLSPPEIKDITLWDNVRAGFVILGSFSRGIIGMSWEPFLLTACLTLWSPVRAFNDRIKKELQILKMSKGSGKLKFFSDKDLFSNVERVLAEYDELKELAELINDAMHLLILAYIFEGIMYYSIHFNALFIATDWYRVFRPGFGIITFLSFFMISSESSNMIQILKPWLSDDRICNEITSSKMMVLLDELANNSVSIRGFIFKVTYSLGIMVLQSVATFFTICSQIGSDMDTE